MSKHWVIKLGCVVITTRPEVIYETSASPIWNTLLGSLVPRLPAERRKVVWEITSSFLILTPFCARNRAQPIRLQHACHMTISKLPENEVATICRLSTRVMESKVVERTVPRLQTSFSDENIKMAILSAFQRLGFDRPTAEQEEAVKEFICGRDVFVSLPTGSY